MPEYMKKRFGGRRLRVYYALVQLVLAILTGISVSLSGWFICMFIVIMTNSVMANAVPACMWPLSIYSNHIR